MSVWTDRILQEFPADLSRFWIALDPDGLLLDERILHAIFLYLAPGYWGEMEACCCG